MSIFFGGFRVRFSTPPKGGKTAALVPLLFFASFPWAFWLVEANPKTENHIINHLFLPHLTGGASVCPFKPGLFLLLLSFYPLAQNVSPVDHVVSRRGGWLYATSRLLMWGIIRIGSTTNLKHWHQLIQTNHESKQTQRGDTRKEHVISSMTETRW